MITLQKGNTELIYYTATEKATLTNPYFLFYFKNRVTSNEILFMATNISTTARYDKSTITVNTNFLNEDTGLWEYKIYEKALNNDLTLTGNIVETGYMNLLPSVPFAPTEYSDINNTFVEYNGQ